MASEEPHHARAPFELTVRGLLARLQRREAVACTRDGDGCDGYGATQMGEDDKRRHDDPRSRWRVLLLIKSLDYGGAERLLVEMAQRRDRGSFEYEAAYVLDERNGLSGAMWSTGTPVFSLGAKGDWDLRWMTTLWRLLIDRRYDVVHCHLPYAASLGRLVVRSIPRSSRPKVVYTHHCTWGKISAPVRALDRATIGLDDALVTVSESARQSLPKSLRPRAQVVIHGVDVGPYRALDHMKKQSIRREVHRELGIPDDMVVVLTVANLRPEKGYDVLFQAARLLLEREAPVRFLSVGHGRLADELHRIHGELGLGDRFRFLGLRTDVLRLMSGADIFTLASRSEGLPVALMEASSVGLPLVLTAVGDVQRIFTNGSDALIVPPQRPDLLADSLEEVVHDAALRDKLGRGSLNRAEMFDVTSAAHQVESIYHRILPSVS